VWDRVKERAKGFEPSTLTWGTLFFDWHHHYFAKIKPFVLPFGIFVGKKGYTKGYKIDIDFAKGYSLRNQGDNHGFGRLEKTRIDLACGSQ
jgi:hypothetical protein